MLSHLALVAQPVILATQEAGIRRITVKSAWANSSQDPTSKKKKKTNITKKAGGVAQGVGPEFKPQYHKKTNKQTNKCSLC
jgi:hypothetical protein